MKEKKRERRGGSEREREIQEDSEKRLKR